MTKELATFAGGCFWCMVKPFDQMDGIDEVISGYTGGHVENPTYEQVCSETTGHLEAVQITFDSTIFPYEKLVELYWTLIDPTDPEVNFMIEENRIQQRFFIIMRNNNRLQNNLKSVLKNQENSINRLQ